MFRALLDRNATEALKMHEPRIECKTCGAHLHKQGTRLWCGCCGEEKKNGVAVVSRPRAA